MAIFNSYVKLPEGNGNFCQLVFGQMVIYIYSVYTNYESHHHRETYGETSTEASCQAVCRHLRNCMIRGSPPCGSYNNNCNITCVCIIYIYIYMYIIMYIYIYTDTVYIYSYI